MVTLTELGKGLCGDHARVVSVTDAATGLQAFIALHSTARGPAFGGCRMKSYPSRGAALRDALRLSQAMSRKAALAGLPYGGGKCVVLGDPETQKSDALLRALGEAIDRLDGSYLTADDSGTTVRDMDVMRQVTPYARGLPLPSGERCPAAAYGTYLALQAAVTHRFGWSDLAGCRVAVQGLGSLGLQLCAYLAKAGASLVVADVRPERVTEAVQRYGASAVPADRILSAEADVFSPNAFGDVICDASVSQIRAAIVVGGANNQLRAARHGLALHRRGILYVPDYVANAGGLIDVAMEGPGYSPTSVLRACDTIRHTTTRLLREALRLGLTPLQLADQMADERMIPPHAATFRIFSAAQAMA
ncbi:MAG: Leu/Phe/Val dehydrogenase [Paracoccaceae bacterium]